MLVTSLDLETSGLDPKVDRITEIGAVLWDVERRKPVTFLSNLVHTPNASPISAEITELTGIDDQMLLEYGWTLQESLNHLHVFLKRSSAVLVHGGLHVDKGLIERDYAALVGNNLPDIPWVDTQIDFAYPKQMKMRALKYLAADHRHFLDFAHRGLFDAVATVIIASYYDIGAAIELARFPIVKVKADVNIQTKDEAKTRGYYYDNQTRSWYKELRSCLLEHERSTCPFAVLPVDPS